MSDAVSPVDGMDWGAGGVEEGTEEAADVKIALINAVLTQDGAGAANEGESEASRLWRCGTLRSTEPDAAPMLRRAIAAAQSCATKLARSAACCAAQRSVLRFGLPTGYRLWIFDSIRSPLDPQRSSES